MLPVGCKIVSLTRSTLILVIQSLCYGCFFVTFATAREMVSAQRSSGARVSRFAVGLFRPPAIVAHPQNVNNAVVETQQRLVDNRFYEFALSNLLARC